MKIARAAANGLTLSRGLMAPLIFILLIRQDQTSDGLTLLLTGLAIATDYLDGLIARRFAVDSRFGKIADAATDALVFLAIFFGLSCRGVLPLWLPTVFGAREALMYLVIRPTLLRAGIDPGARTAGKLKTAIQGSAAILVIVLLSIAPNYTNFVALPLIGLAAIVSIASLYWYIEPVAIRRGFDQLTLSILSTSAVLWFLQIVIVAIYFELNPASGLAIIIGIHTVLAISIAGTLIVRRNDFLIIDGPPLKRMNMANLLTLVRLTSIPSIVFLITTTISQGTPAWPVLLLLAAVLLTDLADGALARRRSQVTHIGNYIDSSTDYLLLGTGAILLLAYGIGTGWVFAFLIGRLAIQAIAVALVALAGGPLPVATWLGKMSIAAAMILLSGAIAAELATPISLKAEIFSTIRIALEIVFSTILVASAIEKTILSVRTLGQSMRNNRN